MMRPIATVLLVAAGCSQRVYSPPAQAFSLAPIHALPENQRALDVEVSTHSEIFDPPVYTGAGRLRTGVGDNTEVSVEGTAFSVDDTGPSGAPRTIYAGRAGVRTNPSASAVTLFAGGGAGFAPAGGLFTALDAGLALGFENCVLVPVMQASGFVSQPLAPRPIDVTTDPAHMTYDTPARTVGGVVRGGLRLSLSPSACRRGEQASWLYAGFGMTAVADHDSRGALLGAGLGVQVPL